MAKQNKKIKRSTDDLINDAIAQQNNWMENRRNFARRFLKTLNIFARPAPRPDDVVMAVRHEKQSKHSGLRAYWFPIMCAILVVFVAIWVVFVRGDAQSRVVVVPAIPEPVVQTVENTIPSFDIVRIEPAGTLVVAGRWAPHQNISIVINGKIVATERTDSDGEFLEAGAVSGILLSDGQRRTSQLIPHAENSPLGHNQHAHGTLNHVLCMADAVNHILLLVNQGCHQFRGIDVSIPHFHELGRSVIEQLLQQFRLIADFSNGGDGKGSVVGTHRQRLRFIIRNGSHAHVALHSRYIGIEFRSKRSIFNIMNCPIKSILSVHYQSAASGSQMRVIIRSEIQIKHTIFFQRRCKKTAHAKPLSCRFIRSASKI